MLTEQTAKQQLQILLQTITYIILPTTTTILINILQPLGTYTIFTFYPSIIISLIAIHKQKKQPTKRGEKMSCPYGLGECPYNKCQIEHPLNLISCPKLKQKQETLTV